MNKLLVLLLLMWCSMLALPLQASPLSDFPQNAEQHNIGSSDNMPLAQLFQESDITEPRALPQLDETLFLPIVQILTKQLQLPFPGKEPVLTSHFSSKSDNGLHTNFTAGP